ncbi:MAG: ATP-dependent DNA helicase, partial [Planctomycetota bacterium JB042]
RPGADVPSAPDPGLGPAREVESDDAAPIDDGALLRFFGPEGPLAARVPGYVVREAQVGMARAVAAALARGSVQVVEAGTGVGKSFAYLVPAVLHAVTNQRPVVVATRTKNLQAQLFDRDLPRIARALDLPFRATLVKGRADYLCLRRLAQVRGAAERSADEAGQAVVVYLRRFARRARDGDLERVSGWIRGRFPGASAWIDAVRCEHGASGRRCPFGRRCFYPRVAARARDSHLLIANHALALKWPRAFPTPDAFVFDEAHDLVDTATDAFGVRVTDRTLRACTEGLAPRRRGDGLRGLLRRIERRGGVVLERVFVAAEEALAAAGRWDRGVEELVAAAARLEAGPAADGERALVFDERVRDGRPFLALADRAARTAADARRLAAALERLQGDVEPAPESARAAVEEFELELTTARERLTEEATGLDLAFGDDEKAVHWLVRGEGRFAARFEVRTAPIDVGEEIARFVLEPTRAVVLTSATLRVGERFDFFAHHLGVDRIEEGRDAEPLFLGSPYDYREALRFYVPLGGPHPLLEDPEAAVRSIVRAALLVARGLGGKTLVLFNARSRMTRVAELLRAPLAADGIRLLCPGPDGGIARVLDRFRREDRAVLLGARAFWEGVDAPGGRVRCAILERIPFESPAEPVHGARTRRLAEEGENGFLAYSLPRAIVRLLQGAGRVVRGEGDRGAVLILDPRVATHPRYGGIVRASLPAGCEIGPEERVFAALLGRLGVPTDVPEESPAARLARATADAKGGTGQPLDG